jgi:thioredoxin-related protein
MINTILAPSFHPYYLPTSRSKPFPSGTVFNELKQNLTIPETFQCIIRKRYIISLKTRIMKFLTLVLAGFLFFTSPGWLTDLEKAKTEAKASHKQILLNFSGSDWCGPCIKLTREVFDSESFKKYANEKLVLVNADFPRLKKNQLSKELVKSNEALADQYNRSGNYPLTLLLDEDGKVLKKWEGNPGLTPEEFIKSVENLKQ